MNGKQSVVDQKAASIDDSRPVPSGTCVGAVRLVAILGTGEHFGAEGHLLMPASGRFKNAGIWLTDELWTFTNPECPTAKVASSLRKVLETGGGSPSLN